ncbi:hypothetical protein [Streptomyces sp. NPDC007088]|uniref:hypothetical protein n=1 Tax=Streptomyces sp. NPDC007088 TaxID=3364773 RepID=UPI00368B1C39
MYISSVGQFSGGPHCAIARVAAMISPFGENTEQTKRIHRSEISRGETRREIRAEAVLCAVI